MIEVLRTSDLVRLDYATRLLESEGCPVFQADQFISSIEGGISAFPRRLLVPDEWAQRAFGILAELERRSQSDPS